MNAFHFRFVKLLSETAGICTQTRDHTRPICPKHAPRQHGVSALWQGPAFAPASPIWFYVRSLPRPSPTSGQSLFADYNARIGPSNAALKATEDRLRALFVSEPGHPDIADPHVLLQKLYPYVPADRAALLAPPAAPEPAAGLQRRKGAVIKKAISPDAPLWEQPVQHGLSMVEGTAQGRNCVQYERPVLN